MSSKPEPRFDLDYSYGRQGELLVDTFLKWIVEGTGKVEVKRKRYFDLYFYVETHCDKGRTGEYRPSGILVTTAQMWAFVIADTKISVLFPVEFLKEMLDDATTRDRREDDGRCPTRGKLLNLAALLFRYQKRLEARSTPSQEKQEESKPQTPTQVTADDINWSF